MSITRMPIVTADGARGWRRLVTLVAKRRYGVVPGILRVMLYDVRVGRAIDLLYSYLHLRKSSPMTRLQREMLATVVNGKVGGAP